MHEVSLGGTLRDYLTGAAVERTTYEDLRQALARYLVEERGWPTGALRPRVEVVCEPGGQRCCRTVDLLLLDAEGQPLLAVLFCAGAPGTYERESLAAARLLPGGPAPLALVTDTRHALLLETAGGAVLAQGMAAVPTHAEVLGLAAAHPPRPLDAPSLEREARILHAYTGFLKTCCGESCELP